MAITLTSQLTDVSLDPGSPTNLGTANAQASETVIQLQGSNCAATGHSGTPGSASPTIANMRGMYTAVTSFTRTDMHVHIWIRDLYPVRSKALNGVSVYVFGSSEALYGFDGNDTGYAGGWYHAVLNLDPTTRPAADIGTAPSANITRVGYEGNLSADKGESFLQNCYFDAVRRGTGGQGVSFYGGTSGARETFLGCVAADTAFYGMLRNVGGALFVEGPLTWGVATQTTYIQESLQTLNFSNFTTAGAAAAVAPSYYRIVLADGTTGVTNIDFSDVTFKGVSRATPFRFTANLGAGDAYTSLRTTYLFGEDITLNTLCTSDSDNFIECQTVIPGGITLTAPAFSNCDAVTLTAANDAISGGQTNLHNTATSVAFVTTDDLDKVTGHTFVNTAGTGWAIDLGTVGANRTDSCNNTFTGYSTSVDGNRAIRVSVSSGFTLTINVTGGNLAANMVYNAGLGTVVVNAGVDFTMTNVVSGTNFMLDFEYVTAVPAGTYNGTGDSVLRMTANISGDVSTTGTVRVFNGTYWDEYSYTGISGTDFTGVSPTLSQDYNGVALLVEAKAPALITVDPYTVTVTASEAFRARLAKATSGTLYEPVYFAGNTGTGFARRIEQTEDA